MYNTDEVWNFTVMNSLIEILFTKGLLETGNNIIKLQEY